jgi:hypothetical protein
MGSGHHSEPATDESASSNYMIVNTYSFPGKLLVGPD